MSQVFSGDSVNGGTVSIVTTTASIVVLGNFLNPPFGNAKAVVFATANFTVGAGANFVNCFIMRNPAGENVSIAGAAQSINVTAGNNVQVTLQGCDVIPDGRAVQYGFRISQLSATGNGTVNFSNITAFLISG